MKVWTFLSSANVRRASEQQWLNVKLQYKLNMLEVGKNGKKFQRNLLAKSSGWKSNDLRDVRSRGLLKF
jgi:hypothetical protein